MSTTTRIDRGSTGTTTIYSDGGDLVFERAFDAPREQVWKAFTDREIIPRWWGPHGTTTTVAEMDVRPGGKWRYVSQAPDRDEVSFYGEYLEIDPPRSFKWTFLFDVDGVGPQGGAERSSSRTSTVEPGSRPSATWVRSKRSKALSPWAWWAARSRPGTASRRCSPRADASTAGVGIGSDCRGSDLLHGDNTGIWRPDTPRTDGAFLGGTTGHQRAASARIAFVYGREVRGAIMPGTGVTNLRFFVIVLEAGAKPTRIDILEMPARCSRRSSLH